LKALRLRAMTTTTILIILLLAAYLGSQCRCAPREPRISRAERRKQREWRNSGRYAQESQLRWQAHQAGLKYRPPPGPPLSDKRFCTIVIVANVIALLTWELIR
jgi:hypothetical protein